MKGKYWVLIIGILLAGLGVGIYFYTRRSDDLSVDPYRGIQGCVKVPSAFIAYTDDFSKVDWGAYADSMQKYLGIEKDEGGRRALVEAFFKQINVEPRSTYVKYFRKDIEKYLQSGPGLPHWDVEIGTLKCT
ncbi:MAG TPA: hypothetical protein VJ953_18535 [Saprospiraceae bacterium]|nr:hypothetical protein [Saprospiraceae bacterium]